MELKVPGRGVGRWDMKELDCRWRGRSYYKVESTVTCGSGQLQVARKQEVWVRESLSD